jgi:hypothetical protein
MPSIFLRDLVYLSQQSHNVVIKLLVGTLEVIVDNDLVVGTGNSGEVELLNGGRKTLLDGFFGLGSAAAETLLELHDGGGLDENELGVEVGFLHLLDTLGDS